MCERHPKWEMKNKRNVDRFFHDPRRNRGEYKLSEEARNTIKPPSTIVSGFTLKSEPRAQEIVDALWEHGELRTVEICAKLKISEGVVKRILKGFLAEKYISKRIDGKNRHYYSIALNTKADQ
jgi:hypothetical protein